MLTTVSVHIYTHIHTLYVNLTLNEISANLLPFANKSKFWMFRGNATTSDYLTLNLKSHAPASIRYPVASWSARLHQLISSAPFWQDSYQTHGLTSREDLCRLLDLRSQRNHRSIRVQTRYNARTGARHGSGVVSVESVFCACNEWYHALKQYQLDS